MIFIKIKQKFCSHLFDPPDMKPRDGNGLVKWACCKCGKEFTACCGLDILSNGKSTGNWGSRIKKNS